MNADTPASHFAAPAAQSTRGKLRRGNRNKLAQRFFEDMYAAWEEQGEAVIRRAFFHDPVASLGVVARLMPQKLEISTPTDGMTDERLQELMEVAERMARVSAGVDIKVIEHVASHENGDIVLGAQTGGGGPVCEMGGGGENTSSALRRPPENDPAEAPIFAAADPATAAQSGDMTNKLSTAEPNYRKSSGISEGTKPSIEDLARARAAEEIDPESLF